MDASQNVVDLRVVMVYRWVDTQDHNADIGTLYAGFLGLSIVARVGLAFGGRADEFFA